MGRKLTGHEKIAARNIRAAFNYEIGGYYNSYLDGEEDFPTLNEVKEIIYECAICYRYAPGAILGLAPREMRFAGKEFCKRYINKRFESDIDAMEIPWREE